MGGAEAEALRDGLGLDQPHLDGLGQDAEQVRRAVHAGDGRLAPGDGVLARRPAVEVLEDADGVAAEEDLAPAGQAENGRAGGRAGVEERLVGEAEGVDQVVLARDVCAERLAAPSKSPRHIRDVDVLPFRKKASIPSI